MGQSLAWDSDLGRRVPLHILKLPHLWLPIRYLVQYHCNIQNAANETEPFCSHKSKPHLRLP
jgi:hypothetical protein